MLDLTAKPNPVIFSTAFTYDAPSSAVAGQMYILKWDTSKANIVYDNTGKVALAADGTIRTNSIFVPSHPHLLASGVCPIYTAGAVLGWDPTLICSSGVSGRTVTFSRVRPASVRQDTVGAQLKVVEISSALQAIASIPISSVSAISDQGGKWSLPLLNGKTYAVWWNSETDVRSITISLPPLF